MSSLELKGLMSVDAKTLERGQAIGANCDLAAKREPHIEGLSNSYQPAAAEMSHDRRPQVC